MELKEYRLRQGMTVQELSDELRVIDSRFTKAIVSYMENGVVDTPDSVKAFLARKQIEINTEPLSYNEDIVLRCLTGHYKDDPVTRSDLKYWSGLPDRIARKAIESLRGRGYWILNDGYGYYLTFDRKEMERWLSVYTARARSVYKTANAMKAFEYRQIEMREV